MTGDRERQGTGEGQSGTGKGRRRARPALKPQAETRDLILAGDRLLSQGDEQAAEVEYRRAAELDPSLAEAHHRLAVALYKRGEFEEARDEAERATDLSPTSVEAWFALGLVLKDARDSAGALAAFDRVLTLQPEHVPALHYRGRTHYQAGAAREAARDFEGAAELSPESAHIAHDAAVANVACRNWPEAERWFERCVALEPHNAETYYELGQAHEQDATTPDADAEAAYLKAVELSPQHLPALFRLAVLWARRRHTDREARAQALETLQQMARREDLVTLFPDAHLVHYLLGAILDDTPEAAPQAAEAYRRCLELNPRFAPAHNNLGVLLMGSRDFVRAAEHLKQAVICDPHNDSAFHNLCRIWYDQPNDLAAHQIGDLVDLAPAEAPDVISRMMGHLVDAAKSDAYASSYDKIHEIKNVIAILGARMRKALAAADPVEAQDLMELHDRAFEAIRSYLAAIHSHQSEREALDCAEVLEKALRPLITIKPPGVRVEKAVEPGLPTLIGDRRRLTQLFQNLIVNAFEAMPDGGVLTMRAQDLGPEAAGPRATVRRGVRISIEDTGPGMTDGELRRAFDPGYTTKESGSGYGLAVAGQVTREHGGNVWLERTEEGGTRAVVELPEQPQPEAAAERLRLRPIMFEDWRRLIHSELDPIQPTDGSVQRGRSHPSGESDASWVEGRGPRSP